MGRESLDLSFTPFPLSIGDDLKVSFPNREKIEYFMSHASTVLPLPFAPSPQKEFCHANLPLPASKSVNVHYCKVYAGKDYLNNSIIGCYIGW